MLFFYQILLIVIEKITNILTFEFVFNSILNIINIQNFF